MKTPQLLREYRNTLIHISALDYDLKLHIHLGHPKIVKEAIAEEIDEYTNYYTSLVDELKKRGL